MSGRARCARVLAEHLSERAGVPVVVWWDDSSGRPRRGAWRVEWSDGPCVSVMRAFAVGHARWVSPLEVAALCWSRQYTARAWAVALLMCARRGELGDTAGEAVALVEYDLYDSDAGAWSGNLLRAAEQLVRRGGDDPRRMAGLLIGVGVMNEATGRGVPGVQGMTTVALPGLPCPGSDADKPATTPALDLSRVDSNCDGRCPVG